MSTSCAPNQPSSSNPRPGRPQPVEYPHRDRRCRDTAPLANQVAGQTRRPRRQPPHLGRPGPTFSPSNQQPSHHDGPPRLWRPGVYLRDAAQNPAGRRLAPRPNLTYTIAMDGGIDCKTAGECAQPAPILSSAAPPSLASATWAPPSSACAAPPKPPYSPCPRLKLQRWLPNQRDSAVYCGHSGGDSEAGEEPSPPQSRGPASVHRRLTVPQLFVEIRRDLGNIAAVNQTEGAQFDGPMICRLGQSRKLTEACSIVIFGASGDLTARKLIPALYHLLKEKQMPPDFRIIGVARREKTDASWRQELRRPWTSFPAPTRWMRRSGRSSRAHCLLPGRPHQPRHVRETQVPPRCLRQPGIVLESPVLPCRHPQPIRRDCRAAASSRI